MALKHGDEALCEVLHTDKVHHHGARPITCVRIQQRLDRMDVASIVHQTVEFADLGENVPHSCINGGRFAKVTRHGEGRWSRTCLLYTSPSPRDS